MDLRPRAGMSSVVLDLIDVSTRTRSLSAANEKLLTQIVALDRVRADLTDLTERVGRGLRAGVTTFPELHRVEGISS